MWIPSEVMMTFHHDLWKPFQRKLQKYFEYLRLNADPLGSLMFDPLQSETPVPTSRTSCICLLVLSYFFGSMLGIFLVAAFPRAHRFMASFEFCFSNMLKWSKSKQVGDCQVNSHVLAIVKAPSPHPLLWCCTHLPISPNFT